MADEGDKTNKATADNITEVPTHLQEFVRSRVIRYISRTKSFSTVIEQTVGQDTAKLVIHCGETTSKIL